MAFPRLFPDDGELGGGGRCSRASAGLLLLLVLPAACAIPAASEREVPPSALRTVVRARDGRPIAHLFHENRRAAAPHQIPDLMKDAAVAAEDERFWRHGGLDARAIVRAAMVDLEQGRAVQGGSTITQQLAKMLFLADEGKSLRRKLLEARLARMLEGRHSKESILAMYLDRAYFGHGAYGIAAASEAYFAKPIGRLMLHEAALLAALLRAPDALDPYDNPRGARVRRDYVLGRMRALGMISPGKESRARAAAIRLRDGRPGRVRHAPHFVRLVERTVLEDPAFGATREDRAAMLYRGGLDIVSTLDARMQRAAERAVSSALGRRGDPDVALVAIDPRTGGIRALVGGRDARRRPFDYASQGRRQPGSTFKPFVLAAAVEDGVGPDAIFESSPTVIRFGRDGRSRWPVSNYDGRGSGPMSVRDGMVRSVNGVFARLVMDVGAPAVAGMARRAGISSAVHPYPSIALGALSRGVSPLELASAYGTFANGGVHVPAHPIARVNGPSGEALLSDPMTPTPAMSAAVAYTVTDVLRDVVRRGTGIGAWLPRAAAGKTGTSQRHRDAWFVGYTPDLVAAVWVGYGDKPRPLRNVRGITVTGGSFPARIWRAFMTEALRETPARDFRVPESMVRVLVGASGDCVARDGSPGSVRLLAPTLVPSRPCSHSSATPSPSPAPPSGPTPSATVVGNG